MKFEMNLKALVLAALAGMLSLFSASASAAIYGTASVDGSKDVLYGTFLTTQTVQTQFGNETVGNLTTNEGELDALYVTNDGSNLYVLLAGNQGTNGNGIGLLFDVVSETNGVNGTIPALSGGDDYFNAGKIGGTTLPDGFNLDYAIAYKAFDFPSDGAPDWRIQTADYVSTPTTQNALGTFAMGETTNPAIDGPQGPGFIFGLNNSNTAGVEGGAGAATGDPSTVNTGSELAIPFSVIGNPVAGDVIRIVAFYANGDFDFWSNQVLPSINPPQGNLGNQPNDLSSTGVNTGFASFTVLAPPASVYDWTSFE